MKETKKDKIVKFVGMIALGILIPNLAGLINNRLYAMPVLMLHYACFIGLSIIIWQGNIWLMYYLRSSVEWLTKQYHKIIIAVFFSNIVYSGVVGWAFLSIWKQFMHQQDTGKSKISITILIIIIAVLFITNIYEIIFLNREKENTLSKVERLSTANAHSELEALKNQIDPHFIFNSLNTLSYLIGKNQHDARLYTDTLARVYRYILSNKERDLVFLKEEIEFMSNYFYLLKIRFNHSINMEIEMADLDTDNFLIPPISLQILIENAVKHNEFSELKKLFISVLVESGYVTVVNEINPKQFQPHPSGIGLANLNTRYKLLTKKNIIIDASLKMFVVKLPILKV